MLYLIAWRLGVRTTRPANIGPEISAEAVLPAAGQSSTASSGSLVLMAALLAHGGALYLGIATKTGIHIGFAHILSAAVWVGVCLLWLDRNHPHVSAMRVMVLPVAAILAPLPLFFPGALVGEINARPLFLPHLVVGVLAYAVLLLAVIHALLMAFAERTLHGHQRTGLLAGFLERLPPVLGMERMLFRLIGVGFVLLSLTVVSGMFFSEEIFGRSLRLDHKTLFTLLAWCVFGVLLLGRRFWGWRGRTALRLTILGCVVVLLGYVGSRFVLEVVLGRI